MHILSQLKHLNLIQKISINKKNASKAHPQDFKKYFGKMTFKLL